MIVISEIFFYFRVYIRTRNKKKKNDEILASFRSFIAIYHYVLAILRRKKKKKFKDGVKEQRWIDYWKEK